MSQQEKLEEIIITIQEALSSDSLVKLSLGNYAGTEATLQKILIKPVLIKSELKLSFTYRHTRQDIVKNFTIKESLQQLRDIVQIEGFRHLVAFTHQGDWHYEWKKKKNSWLLRKQKATAKKDAGSMSHNKQKNRKLDAQNASYLHDLKITDSQGKVYKNAQNKFKQINHYIEILSKLLGQLPAKEQLHVADMGSGKGYLTFALYDYITNHLQRKANVLGIEFRNDLVTLCNKIAEKANFTDLRFVEGTIDDFEAEALDLIIALHACDTATDDAIAKGIQANASLIVVAPCCHKQIRREMEASQPNQQLNFVLKHGIFMERQAEMATDALRAMLLEYHGYKTRVFDFISDAHTPKNVLIVGEKRGVTSQKQEEILQEIQRSKALLGIQKHYLEDVLGVQ